MKKILSLVVILVLVLSLSVPAFATTMKYAVTFPSAGTQAEGAEKFAELV